MDEVNALRRWLTERNRSNEPTDVFAPKKGGALCPDAVNRLFKNYVQRTNQELLIDAGVDFFKVGLIAGRAALSSTLRYAHGSQTLACRAA